MRLRGGLGSLGASGYMGEVLHNLLLLPSEDATRQLPPVQSVSSALLQRPIGDSSVDLTLQTMWAPPLSPAKLRTPWLPSALQKSYLCTVRKATGTTGTLRHNCRRFSHHTKDFEGQKSDNHKHIFSGLESLSLVSSAGEKRYAALWRPQEPWFHRRQGWHYGFTAIKNKPPWGTNPSRSLSVSPKAWNSRFCGTAATHAHPIWAPAGASRDWQPQPLILGHQESLERVPTHSSSSLFLHQKKKRAENPPCERATPPPRRLNINLQIRGGQFLFQVVTL